jgi:PAS domain S-box-containing protein
MILDMRTIIFSYVITDIVCLVVIVLLWRQNRKRFAGTGFFVFDFALQTTALFLIILRGSIPAWMSFVLANTMVIAGALLGYMGLLRFVGKKSLQIHNYILLTAFAFIHTYFIFIQPNQAARNLNLAVVLLIICFQCAWLMLYRVESGRRQLTRGVGIVFAAYCIISVIRIIEYFIGAHLSADYLHSGIFEQLVLIANQMLLILLTYSLALMFNKRLILEITTQEEKFSKAFHSSPYAITITRLTDGQIIEVNEGFFKITGYQLEDIRGKTTSAMHLWNKDDDRALVESELSGKGKVHDREFQFRKKSGKIITGLFSAEIIKINNENCILSSINDITEHRLAESQKEAALKALLENSALLVKISSQVPGMLYQFARKPDGSYSVPFSSHGVTEIFGCSPEDVHDTFAPIFQAIFPEDRHRLLQTIDESTKNLSPWMCEYRVKLPGKEIKWILGNSIPEKLEDGTIVWCGYNIDVTERKKAESQREAAIEEINRLNTELENKVAKRTRDLRDSQLALLSIVEDLNVSNKKVALANQSLDATNKELESFSYSVSHDLRAPLRSIDGFSLALLEDYEKKLDDTGKKYLHKIRAATQHMGLLIEDLLKLSRITHAEFHHESIDLSKIVQSIAETYQQNNPGYDMKMIIQKGIIIKGDLHSMQIAMTNLLENAWKFTGKQKHPLIEFGMTLTEGKKVFFIRDNGAGFDMAYANKLFGAFQRLHSADEFPGTGIGLATVKRIITRHGGQIWAEGEVGKGAVFYFTLP